MASLMMIGERTILERVAIKARSSMLCGRDGVTGSGTSSTSGGDAGHASREPSSLALADNSFVASDSSASSSVF